MHQTMTLALALPLLGGLQPVVVVVLRVLRPGLRIRHFCTLAREHMDTGSAQGRFSTWDRSKVAPTPSPHNKLCLHTALRPRPKLNYIPSPIVLIPALVPHDPIHRRACRSPIHRSYRACRSPIHRSYRACRRFSTRVKGRTKARVKGRTKAKVKGRTKEGKGQNQGEGKG